MVGKRTATNELNRDNWDEVEEPEERGTFRMATDEEIKNRVLKRAKRQLASDNTDASTSNGNPASRSVFSNFKGFGKPSTDSSATKASPFGFLLKSTTTPSTTKPDNEGTPSIMFNGTSNTNTTKPFSFNITPTTSNTKTMTTIPLSTASDADTKTESANTNKANSEDSAKLIYYAKLKGLNRAVSLWIKKHVDENPLCLLTPIFNDYSNYLKQIEEENEKASSTNSSGLLTSYSTDAAEKTNVSSSSVTTTPLKQSTEVKSSITPTNPAGNFNNSSCENPVKFFSFDVKKLNSEATTSSNGGNINTSTSTNLTPTSSKTSMFSFVKPDTSIIPSTKAAFTFGNTGIPFTFSNVKPPASSETAPSPPSQTDDNDEDQPPKVEFTKVIETDAIYSKRCKVFIKKDDDYVGKGVGTLYLKKVEASNKTQLFVRADTNLGNILLNLILNKDIPTKRMGKNNVMLMCFPTPDTKKPSTILLRVKDANEADELLETIDKYKNIEN